MLRVLARRRPYYEPIERLSILELRAPCAGPQAPVRGRRGQRLDLEVSYMAGRKHLPIVELNKAA